MNEQFPEKLTVPGLNTTFLGQPTEQGVWAERCQACGDCVLELTGGLCPIARCAKSLLNGPCGGSQRGICEVYAERRPPASGTQIYDRLKALGTTGQADGDSTRQELDHQPRRRPAQNRAGGFATMSDNSYLVGSNLEKASRPATLPPPASWAHRRAPTAL